MAEPRETSHYAPRFMGSAVVAGATYARRHTLLHLKTFAGEAIDYPVGDVPDIAAAEAILIGGIRPISVKIQNAGSRCTVVALARSGGAQTLGVTLAAALAVCSSGVHTVVEGGLPAETPCSARKTSMVAGREGVQALAAGDAADACRPLE